VFAAGTTAAGGSNTGFLTLLASATGAAIWTDTFGGQSTVSTGVSVAWAPANGAILLGGAYQGTPPSGLFGGGPTWFTALTATSGGGGISATAVGPQIAAVLPGANDVATILGGDCTLTIGGQAALALVTAGATGGSWACSALARNPIDDGYYVAGTTTGDVSVTGAGNGGTLITTPQIFVERLRADGSYVWHQWLAATGSFNEARAVAARASGNVVITGRFTGDIQTTAADGGAGVALTWANTGPSPEAFILELDASGNGVWGYGFGGMGEHIGRALAIDPQNGDVVMAGDFAGNLALPGNHVLDSAGGRDIMLLRFASAVAPTLRWSLQLGDAADQLCEAVAIASVTSDIAIAGQFRGAITFPAGSSALPIQSLADLGGYVVRLTP
jgi:hypothetical protein